MTDDDARKEVLIIGASTRNQADNDTIVTGVSDIGDSPTLYEYIEQRARAGQVSNTEGCGIAAAYGALTEGVPIQYIRLNDYMDKTGAFHDQDVLLQKISSAAGYIFLSPVYFGDRTSLLADTFALMHREGLMLGGKVSGMISVGAKRNGGQETTNIYTLHELLQLDSLAVGNGPPTSQYGGTAVGGNIGTMDNDYFGIMTSMGTGSRVAKTVRLLQSEVSEKPRIVFWVPEDRSDRRLLRYVEKLISSLPAEDADWDILDLTQYRFHQCIACNRCPGKPSDPVYKCVLKNDDMAEVQPQLVNCDGFILCGLNCGPAEDKISNYQRFVERTRYLRRDNFRLTDRIFCSLSIDDPFANNSFDIKVLTSFIRHNAIGHRGIRILDLPDGLLEPDIRAAFKSFTDHCGRSASWRKGGAEAETVYRPVGYV